MILGAAPRRALPGPLRAEVAARVSQTTSCADKAPMHRLSICAHRSPDRDRGSLLLQAVRRRGSGRDQLEPPGGDRYAPGQRAAPTSADGTGAVPPPERLEAQHRGALDAPLSRAPTSRSKTCARPRSTRPVRAAPGLVVLSITPFGLAGRSPAGPPRTSRSRPRAARSARAGGPAPSPSRREAGSAPGRAAASPRSRRWPRSSARARPVTASTSTSSCSRPRRSSRTATWT
jgi:hypothetical protein